jgi:hypothetical protein
MKDTYHIEIESKNIDYELRKHFRTKFDLTDRQYLAFIEMILNFYDNLPVVMDTKS